MLISKAYSKIAAISLFGLAAVAPGWAQESGGEIESFNRSLGLEGMASDLAAVQSELAHNNPASTPTGPKEPGRQRKKEPVRREPSFSNLSFHPNPSVSGSDRAYYISHTQTGVFAGMPSFDTLISRFDRRFENYGYSSHNLGDALAGYLIISWEILHNADASETPGGIRRVRQVVGEILEKRGKAAQLSSDAKQKYSELFKGVSELYRERIKRLQQENNVALEKQLKNQIAQAPLKLGLDLRRYRLTDQGFING